MDISTIKQDSAAIEAGQWVENIPDWPGARFRTRGLNSATAETLRDTKIRALPDSDRDDDGNVKPDVVKRIAREVLAEAVLLEWDGLTDAGKPFAYDPTTAAKLLTNPDFKKFQDIVAWCAGKVDRLNTGAKAAASKNSAAPSSGN
jgi:hypothetical protein